MKLAKFCVAALVGAGAMGAFADAANVLISFSTKAPVGDYKGDTYADGAAVLDGEWYALVWSADGNFDGITTEGNPVDANDAVVLMAPLAKGGHCPYTVFQIDSKSVNAKESGTYAVYLLDTRSADKTAVAAKGTDGKPVLMNGAKAAMTYAAASATAGGATAKTGSDAAVWGASAVPANVPQPIVRIQEIGAEYVTLTAEGLVPGVKYNVRMGTAPDKLDTYALDVPQMSDNATFKIKNGEHRFFQIVREPLN